MSDYTAIPLTGKLKLKGVKDSAISKKKKKKDKKPSSTDATNARATTTINDPANDKTGNDTDDFPDNSVMLRTLEDEDRQIIKEDHRRMGVVDGQELRPGAAVEDSNPELSNQLKTEAERRHEEQRRRRLEDRLKKEGVKTHKQRVEELNKYLSGLSEHHDMPKIGPG